MPRRERDSTVSKNRVASSIAVKPDLDQIEIEFLGFGQSIYEGGKPQFYYTVRLTSIDTAAYFALCAGKAGTEGLDIDRLICVADYEGFRFKKGELHFSVIDPATGKRKKKSVLTKCEMSYFCNLWHYEQQKKSI